MKFKLIFIILFSFILLFEGKAQKEAKFQEGTQEEKNAYFERLLGTQEAFSNSFRSKELDFVKNLPQAKLENQERGRTQYPNWTSRGANNVGGRTRTLAYDISNEKIIFVGGVTGGLYRSTDYGAIWTKVTHPLNTHLVNSIVQDSRPGFQNIWYYGTGEGSLSYVESAGNGLFKSLDSGKTWSIFPSTQDNEFFTSCNQLLIHPSSGDLYAAISHAIVKSEDGGESFITLVSDPNQIKYSYFTDVAITPLGTIYISISRRFGAIMDIYRSEDGDNWTLIMDHNNFGLQQIERILI